MDVEKIISSMSLKDKIAFCTGADFWNTKKYEKYGIPAIKTSDGPHGLRCQINESDMLGINESHPATCFPTAVTAGATWNRELYGREGRAIAKEARAAGVSVLLGPGCNIKRNPLGGRSFEYISEDPYLSGYMAAEFIKGVQSEGVAACVKHFAANNQEYKRQSSDSIVDERTLREIYLKSFEIAVREGRPYAVMSSYNKINGVYASDNKWLLDGVLRRDWGFDGAVITDWGGMNDRIAAFRAGCDLTMPGGSKYMHRATERAVRRGELDEECINESVRRLLRLIERVQDTAQDTNEAGFELDEHHALAKSVAEQGAVLLKNDGDLLPIVHKDAVLIGRMAKELRYQGTGSSHINPTKIVSLTEAMADIECICCGDELGEVSESEIAEAVSAAKRHKSAIVAVGLPESYESEAFDREHMRLPEGYCRLVCAVAEANENVAVVLFGGGAMELPFADKVKAILYMGLPGQAGGEAAADIITGRVNPSGKLTESWPEVYSDVVCSDFYGLKNAEYREGIYVGYRYYDKADLSPRYPFGHGLSYTRFEYSELEINGSELNFLLKNVGERRGAEVVQLYVAPPGSEGYKEKKRLCGFERVELDAGESRRVCFKIDESSLATWRDGWRVESGEYTVMVASSSRDIRLSVGFFVEGDEIDESTTSASAWYSDPVSKPAREDLETLLRRKISVTEKLKKRDFNLSSTISEMKDSSLFMKLVGKIADIVLSVKFKSKSPTTYRMMLASVVECPIRSMEICSGGAMNDSLAKLIIAIAKIL